MSVVDTLMLVTAQATDGNPIVGMLPIILMFVVLYFLMIRPQMKRQKEQRNMVAALAKGDEVITNGGVLGKVTKVSDSYITLEISHMGDKPIEIIQQRTAVVSVLPKGTIKSL